MGSYDFCKGFFPAKSQSTIVATFGAGLLSGLLGSVIATPFDLVKIRMQAPGNEMRLFQHFTKILKEDGPKGLYRGVVPTAGRAMVLTSS